MFSGECNKGTLKGFKISGDILELASDVALLTHVIYTSINEDKNHAFAHMAANEFMAHVAYLICGEYKEKVTDNDETTTLEAQEDFKRCMEEIIKKHEGKYK